jgi:hypothetical protein
VEDILAIPDPSTQESTQTLQDERTWTPPPAYEERREVILPEIQPIVRQNRNEVEEQAISEMSFMRHFLLPARACWDRNCLKHPRTTMRMTAADKQVYREAEYVDDLLKNT